MNPLFASAALVGIVVPLALLVHGLRRGRVAVVLLALCVGLSANVAFLAHAVPAAALTDNSSVFTFRGTTVFAGPNSDMAQGYSPSSSATTCGAGAGWMCAFSSDQFTAAQGLAAGTAQTDLYVQESGATPAFKAESHQGWVNGTTCSQGVPASTVPGDLMIYTITFTDGTGFTVTPQTAGWTLIRRTDNGTTIGLVSYWKVYQAGDPATFNVTFSAQTRCLGVLATYSGVDGTTPIDVENGQTTASATTHATPSVTTTGANRLVVTTHIVHSVATWTAPAGMTERVDFSNNGSGQAVESMEFNDLPQASAGATGAKTATATVGDVGITQITTLRPASTCGITATLKQVTPPKYRSSSSATVLSGTTLTINKPANLAQNDVMIAAIAANQVLVTPAGWTFMGQYTSGTLRTNLYRRTATSSEAASYSWTLNATGYGAGAISAYHDVDTTTPIDVFNGAATASGTSHTTPTLTTTRSDEMMVSSFSIGVDDTWAPPAAMTERVDVVTTTTFVALEQADAVSTSYGPTSFTATAWAQVRAGSTV